VIEQRRIAVVVPARDEARHIERVLASMPAFVDHVVVVDDGSRDDTAVRARAAGARVLAHGESRGVGAAIASGYRIARRHADVVAVMAGDGQMDPDDLRAVVIPVVRGAADYVKGNRLAHTDVVHMPLARRAGTTLLGWLTALAIGVPLGDSQCGYTAIAAHAIDAIDLDALWPRYGYPNDLLAALAAQRFLVTEVTVRPVYRDEASGLRPWHVATIGWLIGRAAWRRTRAQR
jgi:glycosyltransferase involved in cell wall biosynthesis